MFVKDVLDHMQRLYFLDERITLIFSPHTDDIFFSLGNFIKSGELGRNIIGVNVFTMSATSAGAKIKRRNFELLAKTSVAKMREELGYASYLSSLHIRYVPFFLGLRDVRLKGVGTYMQGYSQSGVEKHFYKLKLDKIIDSIVSQLKPKNTTVIFPGGFGDNMDHKILSTGAETVSKRVKVGIFADIPYVARYGSMEELKRDIKKGFENHSSKRFVAGEKMRQFNKIYKSQLNSAYEAQLKKVEGLGGESIFWRN